MRCPLQFGRSVFCKRSTRRSTKSRSTDHIARRRIKNKFHRVWVKLTSRPNLASGWNQKIFSVRAEARRHIVAQYGLFAIKIVSIFVNPKPYDPNGHSHPNRVRGDARINISWRTSPAHLDLNCLITVVLIKLLVWRPLAAWIGILGQVT